MVINIAYNLDKFQVNFGKSKYFLRLCNFKIFVAYPQIEKYIQDYGRHKG